MWDAASSCSTISSHNKRTLARYKCQANHHHTTSLSCGDIVDLTDLVPKTTSTSFLTSTYIMTTEQQETALEEDIAK
jgi:Fe2+ or Zn2+ uptake regulation protein